VPPHISYTVLGAYTVFICRSYLVGAYTVHCEAKFKSANYPFLFSFSAVMGDAAAEIDAEDEYNRTKADPSIGISDLQAALERYFVAMGYRNLQEVLDLITGKNPWKSAAQAMSLNVFSCFS